MIQLSRMLMGRHHAPVVYFARIGSNVKIGTTENLKQRMDSLYVPLENVLAVVPGGKEEEDAYHERFEACRVHAGSRRELFRIEGHLKDFLRFGIETWAQEKRSRAAALGLPPMASEKVMQVLLRLLAAPGGTTARQAAAAIGKSKATAKRYLNDLRERGVAEMTGAGRGSRWRLARMEEQP
jgi:hypothetical protein